VKVCTVLLLYNILGYKFILEATCCECLFHHFHVIVATFHACFVCIGVNHGGWRGCIPKNLRWEWIYYHPPIRMLTLQPSGAQQSSVKYQFYIHFQNNYQLGGVRPLDPLLGLRPWTPLGSPSGVQVLCPRIHSPLRQSIPQSYRAVDVIVRLLVLCIAAVRIQLPSETALNVKIGRVVFGAGKRPRRRKKGPTVDHTDVQRPR